MNKKDYSRRSFLKQNAFAGLGSIALGTLGMTAKAAGVDKPGNATIQTIAGLTTEQIRDKYKEALFNRFVPNMDSLVIDHQYGGFMCSVDIAARRLLSTNKSAWFEGRGMWTYSFLYNNFGKDPRFLEVARKSKDFILKHQPKDGNFWPASYTREGTAVTNARQADIYSNLFIAEGLAEFSKASGEQQYRDLAKKIVLSAVARYDSPDYEYRIGYAPEGCPDLVAPRVLGHWMVLLRASTQFLEQGADPDIEKLAGRCVEAIMKYHLNPEFGLLNEGINHDMSRAKNGCDQFAYLGHGIETIWMVMAEAVRRKDTGLFNTAIGVFKKSVSVATDPVEGGYFRSLDNVSTHTFKTDKVAWLQEEVLIGTMIMMEHLGNDEWAREHFDQTYHYFQDKYVRPELAFITPGGDRGMVTCLKNRAEHYHHPRHLMLNLLALERIIRRKGKPSGVFG